MPEIMKYNSDFTGEVSLTATVRGYMNNNRLYIGLNEGPDMFANLTVNIDAPCPEYCAYVDANNLSKAEEFINDNELGEFSGFTAVSGYHEYPLYTFDPDRLREIDPDGMRCYEQINGLGAGKTEEREQDRGGR